MIILDWGYDAERVDGWYTSSPPRVYERAGRMWSCINPFAQCLSVGRLRGKPEERPKRWYRMNNVSLHPVSSGGDSHFRSTIGMKFGTLFWCTLKLTRTGFIDLGIIAQFIPLSKMRMYSTPWISRIPMPFGCLKKDLPTFPNPWQSIGVAEVVLLWFEASILVSRNTARWSMDILVRGQSNDHQSGNIPINVAWTHPFFTLKAYPWNHLSMTYS